MHLIRLDSNPNPKPDEFPNHYYQTEHEMTLPDDVTDGSGARVRIDFPRFGRGDQRKSDFAVEIDWIDMSRLLKKFVEIGQPDAIHLLRMVRLADAIEKAGWSPDDAPEEGFWETWQPLLDSN